MATTLCFDFGNTRLKCSVFEKDVFSHEILLENDSTETVNALLKKYHPEKTILSSVINHNPAIETNLNAQTKFHKLSHLTILNFTTPVGKPETIGADRLALVAAAVYFFPNKNNLVIALGSCVTYNFINQYHEFIGGAISPGLEMRFRSMNEHTALLPLAKAEWNFPVIAYDTKTNLQSGVIAGITFEIDGFIDFYKNKYDNFNVILTGGDSAHFARRLKNNIFADQNFLTKGLYAISEINNI
ncbi:MAG: type III pantothenate kinase [Ferruginibacter sp.]